MPPCSAAEIMAEWVLVKKWCQLTGETPQAIHDRRRRGIWLDGKHCKVVGTGRGGRLWVNTKAANSWIESN